MTTIAGGGVGDGAEAPQACLAQLEGITIDNKNNLAYVMHDGRVRQWNLTSNIVTHFAGTGEKNFAGDNGKATEAAFSNPMRAAIDEERNIVYILEANRVRAVNRNTGIVTSVAGTSSHGISNDGM